MNKNNSPHSRRHFLTAAGVGAAATVWPADLAAQQTDDERANVDVVNEFCATFAVPFDWNRMTSLLSPDCRYRATQTAPVVEGPEAIVAFLLSFAGAAASAEFEVVDTWARGPVVVNDRVDRFALPQRTLDIPVVGVFHVVDGLITEWSDFVFDFQP